MVKKVRIEPDRPVYPTPAALITTADKDGKPNIITLGEVFNVGIKDPTILGIAVRPHRYSYQLIQQTGEFCVNLPPVTILRQVDLVGTRSGKTGIDKFKEYGLTPMPADEITPPLIAECPVNLECRVISMTTVGDHELILGECVAAHVDEDKLDDKMKPFIEKMQTFIYAENAYYEVGKKIASAGFSRNDSNAHM